MNDKRKRRFDARAFVSLALLWDFLFIGVSAVVLYIMPHGRVAYWMDWHLLGLDKNTWETVHTVSGVLMMVLVPFHLLVYNWNFLKHYFVKRTGGINLWREILGSLVLVLVLMVTSIAYVFPSSTIMNAGEAIKNSWAKGVKAPPVPHAESLTMEEFAGLMGMDLAKVEKALTDKGLKNFDKSMKIKDIAKQLGTSPKQIFEQLEPLATRKKKSITGGTYGGSGAKKSSTTTPSTGTGPGAALGLYMSVEEYAKKWGLDPARVTEFLKKKGAKDVSSVRAAAWELGLRPRDLHDQILKALKK